MCIVINHHKTEMMNEIAALRKKYQLSMKVEKFIKQKDF